MYMYMYIYMYIYIYIYMYIHTYILLAIGSLRSQAFMPYKQLHNCQTVTLLTFN